MRYTIFPGATARPTSATVMETPAPKFLDWLADPVACPSLECRTTDDKIAGPAVALATWVQGADSRSQSLVAADSATEVLLYDLDDMPAEALAEAAARWTGLDWAAYSTFKHAPGAPKLRLAVRLDAPLSTFDKVTFRGAWAAAADVLGLQQDTQACSPSNLFFLPQHKPGIEPARARNVGAPLSLEALLGAAAQRRTRARESKSSEVGAVGTRPDAKALKATVRAWEKSKSEYRRACANALAAVSRGERYAQDGHVYQATQHLAFALSGEWPDLDVEFFVSTWLEPSWRQMWPGEGLDRITQDWERAWDSALSRRRENAEERAEELAAVRPEGAAQLTEEQLARAHAHRGALVVHKGAAYYVYDPVSGAYCAPVRATGVGPRARDYLATIPGVYLRELQGERPRIKPATTLLEEYGCVVETVNYWGIMPEGPAYDPSGGGAINIPAYKWNEFNAVEHPIVTDLIDSMAGDDAETYRDWLALFRDIRRPLAALVLVGPPGVWKSKTATTLSRFWGPRHSPTASRAEHVLRRFSAPLLQNPLVWSDEQLATSEQGKPIPERYRESISEITHMVETKGVDPVVLHSATRHVIAVNAAEKVFGVSQELGNDAVAATLARFFKITICGERMAEFEARWAATSELAALREGTPLLEHVMWLEQTRKTTYQGRFGVASNTTDDEIARAQMANHRLGLIMQLLTDAVIRESRMDSPGEPGRSPLHIGCDGVRLRHRVLAALWGDDRITRRQRWVASAQEIQGILTACGFRAEGDSDGDGMPFDVGRWLQWLRLSEMYDVGAVQRAVAKLGGLK